MASLIFANNPIPFYENLPHRKSYISVKDGVMDDTQITMIANQEEYMRQFFPQNENMFSDKINFQYIDMFTRKITIQVNRDIPQDIYPNTYEFWNNVSYARLNINNFVEFLYVKDRKLLNVSINLWEFTFTVDIWNTYWIEVYQDFKNNNTPVDFKPVHVVRAHIDRFTKVTYKSLNFYVFSFLYDQSNNGKPFSYLLNKESFDQTITSNYTTDVIETLTPWTDYNIIKNYKLLKIAYGSLNTVKGDNITTFGNYNGFLTAFLNTDNKSTIQGYQNLKALNGCLNTYILLPLINDLLLETNKNTINIDIHPDVVSLFDNTIIDSTHNQFQWTYNSLERVLGNPQLATIIQTPKPLLVFNAKSDRRGSFLEPRDYDIWNNWAYPIRTRNNYRVNSNVKYIGEFENFKTDNRKVDIGSEVETVVGVNSPGYTGDPTKELFNINPANITQSMGNALCDERIPLFDLCSKLSFTSNRYSKTQKKVIDLEPKIYDDNLTYINYGHYNNTNFTISLRWYFFNNLDDLLYWKSIFIQGYQFVQPHFSALIQWPSGGLYENPTYVGDNILSSFFAPNMETITDQQASFLLGNRVQMNTALNNKFQNTAYDYWGMGLNTFGNFLNPNNISLNPIKSFSNFANGIYNGVKPIMNFLQGYNEMKAKIKDLGNSPSSTTEPVGDSTFKMLNSYNAYGKIQSINEFDKLTLWSYHAEHGYLINNLLLIKTFATRIYYNYWQLINFKIFLTFSNISNEIKDYFENLFQTGLTLWHTFTFNDQVTDQVGLYDYENWEISIFNDLEKPFGTEIKTDTDKVIILRPSSINPKIVKILNFSAFSNLNVDLIQKDLKNVVKINYNQKDEFEIFIVWNSFPIGTANILDFDIRISAFEATEPFILSVQLWPFEI